MACVVVFEPMDIYFLGAISGLENHRKDYELIVRLLQKRGDKVQSDHILKRDPTRPETFKIKDDALYYKVTMERISTADIMVAEISYPTVNIGYEISYALENKVPVIALYNELNQTKISPLLIGNSSEYLKVRGYRSDTIKQVLDETIDQVNLVVNDRFSISLSKNFVEYFDWMSRKHGVSKTKLIKSTIEDRIRNDRQYQKYVAESKK